MVEGYVDVIAMSEAGFPNVVAPLGTALTADQCALLWAMASEPILCFDGDKAGRKAAFRAIETALPLIGPGKSLRFALLPEGQDPDDLARSERRRGDGRASRGRAGRFADMLFLRETDEQTFDTPEQRAALERRLREAVGEHRRRDAAPPLSGRHEAAPFGVFGDERERPAARRRQRETSLRAKARRARFPRAGPAWASPKRPCPPQSKLGRKRRLPPREAMILSIALGHPALIESHCEELAETEFVGAGVSAFRDALLAARRMRWIRPRRSPNALNGAGRGPRPRADFGRGRKDAELVVHAAGGCAC